MTENLKEKLKRQIIAAHLPLTDVVTKSGSMDELEDNDSLDAPADSQ